MSLLFNVRLMGLMAICFWGVCFYPFGQVSAELQPPQNLHFPANINLLANSEFQVTLPDGTAATWKYNIVAVHATNDPLKAGNKCLHITTDVPVHQASNMSYIRIDYSDQIPVKGDTLYTLSFDHYVHKYGIGYTVLMRVDWFKQDGTAASIRQGELSAPRMANTKWTTYLDYCASPMDAVTAKIYLLVWGLGTEVYLDNISFVKSSEIPNKASVPLKIMYWQEKRDKREEAIRTKNAGFDMSYLYWKCYEESRWEDLEYNLKLAKSINLPVFVVFWLSELSSPDFRKQHPLIDFEGSEYEKTPSIFHEEWWDLWAIPQIMKVVNVSRQYGIKGILFDFELYGTPSRITDVCYCEKCLTKFAIEKSITIQGSTLPEKAKWLLDNEKLDSYRSFQKNRLEAKLRELRKQVDLINSSFQFGNLPYYDFLTDRAFVEMLGKDTAPFIIATERTYNLQSPYYSDLIGADLASGYVSAKHTILLNRGYNVVTIGGVTPYTTTAFLENKIRRILRTGVGGFWFYSRRMIDDELFRLWATGKSMTRQEADSIWEVLKNIE